LQGDARDPAVQASLQSLLGGPADVLLSDMAPKLAGIKHADAARHAELVLTAIEMAPVILRPEGSFVAKLFMDAEYEGLIRDLRATFLAVKTVKLDTTRQHSSELYVVGKKLRP
jgi:23S rRNA (uridine2552-2'-O)-methyltransferase